MDHNDIAAHAASHQFPSVIGRFADAFQIAWGLLYWNLRKSWFRLRRGQAPCPCQTPSDSGRAMETGCEPALAFSEVKRFRRVCPLLKPDSAGHWKCSVDTTDVRPFWSRAFSIYGATLIGVYLALTLSGWALLRFRGYNIGYPQIAWPGKWSQFHEVQSRFFAEKANLSLARHEVGEAIMSLSIAYQLDPKNYGLGMLFARLTQAGQPALSDQVYSQVIQAHPEHRAETLSAWYESLLWRADFHAIVSLANDALSTDQAHANAWLNTLLTALRRAPDETTERKLAAQTTSPLVRDVLALDLQTLGTPAAAKAALLTPPPTDAPAFFNYYIPQRLIEVGAPREALGLLTSAQLQLASRDRLGMLLNAYTLLGWRPILTQQINQLLSQPLNEPAVELLAAYLIRHPDREFLATAFDAFKRQAPVVPEIAYREWSSWLFAAGAAGDFARFNEAGEKMKSIAGSDLRALISLKSFFQGNAAHARIESYLPAMQPLPLDVTYALLEAYYIPRDKTVVSP